MKWYTLPLSMFFLLLLANSVLAELAASAGAEKPPVVRVTTENRNYSCNPFPELALAV